MTVVHLHRSTKFNRKSMSAANLVCAKYPEKEAIHKLVWGVIASAPNKVFKLLELEISIAQLVSSRNL